MNRLNLPNVTGLDLTGLPNGLIFFLQATQDALNTLDNGVLYKSDVTVPNANPFSRAASASGQSFTVNGTVVASGDDYAQAVQDIKALRADVNRLYEMFADLAAQFRGA